MSNPRKAFEQSLRTATNVDITDVDAVLERLSQLINVGYENVNEGWLLAKQFKDEHKGLRREQMWQERSEIREVADDIEDIQAILFKADQLLHKAHVKISRAG